MLTRRIVDQILPANSIAEAVSDSEADASARQSTLPTLAAVTAIVVCVIAEAAVLRVGIDDLDEGYFVQQAARVLHGQVPFRDFETLYSPGLTYAHAWLFSLLGGPSLLAARALALAARGALALLLYCLARPLVRHPLWAAAPAIFLLIGFDDAPTRWEPHPGWFSTLFAVLAAWCVAHGSSRRWMFASGLAAAAAFAFKQNTGALILLAVVAQSRSLLPLASFMPITGLWLVPLAIAVGDFDKLGTLVGFFNTGSLFSPPEPAIAIPAACLIAGIWLAFSVPDRRLTAYLLTGVALFATELPRMDTLHLVWSAPVLLVLGAAALDRARPLVVLIVLSAAGVLVLPTLSSRVHTIALANSSVAGLRVPDSTAAALNGVVEDIQARTGPAEPIFVYPSSPLLYVLGDRPNPTRFDHLNPGAASPEQIERLIADLSHSGVRLVVISDFWEVSWGPPGANAALEHWLDENFAEVARDGAYRVLAARL
jgi:hypothetical protein